MAPCASWLALARMIAVDTLHHVTHTPPRSTSSVQPLERKPPETSCLCPVSGRNSPLFTRRLTSSASCWGLPTKGSSFLSNVTGHNTKRSLSGSFVISLEAHSSSARVSRVSSRSEGASSGRVKNNTKSHTSWPQDSGPISRALRIAMMYAFRALSLCALGFFHSSVATIT